MKGGSTSLVHALLCLQISATYTSNLALAGATSNFDVTTVSPPVTPWVLDQPVVHTILTAISHNQHSVIDWFIVIPGTKKPYWVKSSMILDSRKVLKVAGSRKVAKSNFWKGARGPHPIGNIGEVGLNATSPKLPMRWEPPALFLKLLFATLSFSNSSRIVFGIDSRFWNSRTIWQSGITTLKHWKEAFCKTYVEHPSYTPEA